MNQSVGSFDAVGQINVSLAFKSICLAVSLISATISASGQSRTAVSLSPNEVALAQKIGFDSQILLLLKMQVDAPIAHFFVENAPIWQGDSVVGEESRFFDGIQMDMRAGQADTILYMYADLFWTRGYHIFRTQDNFGQAPDQLGVLRTQDPFEAIRVVGTEGLNHGYDQRWVLRYARSLFEKTPFHISGIGREWMEAVLLEPPADFLELARELARICPDLVEQGAGSVEQMALEMEESGLFYLWWD